MKNMIFFAVSPDYHVLKPPRSCVKNPGVTGSCMKDPSC